MKKWLDLPKRYSQGLTCCSFLSLQKSFLRSCWRCHKLHDNIYFYEGKHVFMALVVQAWCCWVKSLGKIDFHTQVLCNFSQSIYCKLYIWKGGITTQGFRKTCNYDLVPPIKLSQLIQSCEDKFTVWFEVWKKRQTYGMCANDDILVERELTCV